MPYCLSLRINYAAHLGKFDIAIDQASQADKIQAPSMGIFSPNFAYVTAYGSSLDAAKEAALKHLQRKIEQTKEAERLRNKPY